MRRAGRVTAALVAIAAAGVVEWRGVAVSRDDACPEAFALDEARAARVLDTLAASPSSRSLAARASELEPTLCFGPADISLVRTDRVLLVDRRLPDDEAAARVAHLLLHLVDGPPLRVPRSVRDCDAAVARAMDAEAVALARELDVRRELGVTRPVIRYEPEDAFRRAPAPERATLVREWLRAHPLGGEGVDALRPAYDARCRAEAGRATSSR